MKLIIYIILSFPITFLGLLITMTLANIHHIAHGDNYDTILTEMLKWRNNWGLLVFSFYLGILWAIIYLYMING